MREGSYAAGRATFFMFFFFLRRLPKDLRQIFPLRDFLSPLPMPHISLKGGRKNHYFRFATIPGNGYRRKLTGVSTRTVSAICDRPRQSQCPPTRGVSAGR